MNPVHLAAEIERSYRRYLETTFYFRDPVLRKSFREALGSGHLAKGPYVESTPVFKRGAATDHLFTELLGRTADTGFLKATERQLYRHQEVAIRKVASRDRNVVVATGTASGKTEAFLYPILLHLYGQYLEGNLESGVRALIIYPMNALANDQRERLGKVCQQLAQKGSDFRFTFGQYTGETPENEKDSFRHGGDKRHSQMPGELVFREDMRAKPPHILLTNYSMLEYLLIRPTDSPLFDDGSAFHWKFLVLDEAHQYRGSKGMEMGMLLRRLKQRLREGGCKQQFRCVATSATLGGGAEDSPQIAQFANDLFDEPFAPDDIVLGETEPISPAEARLQLGLEDYRALLALRTGELPLEPDLQKRLLLKGAPKEGEEDVVCGEALKKDERCTRLRQLVSERPQKFDELASLLFASLETEASGEALADLVRLLLKSKDSTTKRPLLAARYHYFLRSLEGAFLSYLPESRVFLQRVSERGEGAVFEVALCRECGQHYLVGKESGGRLREAIRDPGDPNFGATFYRPLDANEVSSNANGRKSGKILRLCQKCGALTGGDVICGHAESIRVEEQPEAREREDEVPRCSLCNYRAQDPVREVVHGTDGPHVVIATTLFREMPADRRKILAFADSHQEAAFFAWYLESSYMDILTRNLILTSLQALAGFSNGGMSLRELAPVLRDTYRQSGAFRPSTGDIEVYREAWKKLYREILTEEQRISLEGVGLVRLQAKLPDTFAVPSLLRQSPWSLSESEALSMVSILLDFMRLDKAVDLRVDIGGLSWADLGLQGRDTAICLGSPGRRNNLKSWDGRLGRRAQYMARLLRRKTDLTWDATLDCAQEALKAMWEALAAADRKIAQATNRLLLPHKDARVLNPDWWRLNLINDADVIYRCDTCARLYPCSVEGVCPRFNCPGSLVSTSLPKVDENHYRKLYQEELAGFLRVEEHTAQLESKKAREFQHAFKKGEIHVLSSSTTFEVGVDLGDLDLIFLRNVPPEAFNYAQRVGRAGRREEFPGFALTFCRQRPHDLYYFKVPERIVSGDIRPPVLSLTNDKIIRRHMTATALSAFFRQEPDRFRDVQGFFINLENPDGCRAFLDFLKENQQRLTASLRAIVPSQSQGKTGLTDGLWIEQIADHESRLAQAEDEVRSDYTTVAKLEQQFAEEKKYDKAGWARRRRKTIESEDVLSFLSRKAIIPKYGFPVDVVELDLQRDSKSVEAGQVSLQRDLSLAISEFAPTSKLVANKLEWESHGIKKVLEREWEQQEYFKCREHGFFAAWTKGETPPNNPCCDRVERGGRFVVPQFGFVSTTDRPAAPTGRPIRVFSTRPYFMGLSGSAPGEINAGPFKLTKASPGRMAVLCEGRRGQGFYVCKFCGAGFRTSKHPHKSPYGQDCNGTLMQTALGHMFETDVVRMTFVRPFPSTPVDRIWLAYSLAFALLEGTSSVLEVPASDLNTAVTFSTESWLPPIILYDNVPGGAGLVARLEDSAILRTCMEAALERVNGGCGCGEKDSCYGCLRSYRNQFAHQELQRGPAQEYLKTVIAAKWDVCR